MCTWIFYFPKVIQHILKLMKGNLNHLACYYPSAPMILSWSNGCTRKINVTLTYLTKCWTLVLRLKHFSELIIWLLIIKNHTTNFLYTTSYIYSVLCLWLVLGFIIPSSGHRHLFTSLHSMLLMEVLQTKTYIALVNYNLWYIFQN